MMPNGLPLGYRQWGQSSEAKNTTINVNMNISMNVYSAIPFDISRDALKACYLCWVASTNSSLKFGGKEAPYGFGWMAIGKQL